MRSPYDKLHIFSYICNFIYGLLFPVRASPRDLLFQHFPDNMLRRKDMVNVSRLQRSPERLWAGIGRTDSNRIPGFCQKLQGNLDCIIRLRTDYMAFHINIIIKDPPHRLLSGQPVPIPCL